MKKTTIERIIAVTALSFGIAAGVCEAEDLAAFAAQTGITSIAEAGAEAWTAAGNFDTWLGDDSAQNATRRSI